MMKRFLLLLMALAVVSCHKDVSPSGVAGSWQAIHEDWTITTDGVKTTESFDAEESSSDDFAVLEIVQSSFYLFSSSTAEKSLTLSYSDRFSALVNGSTKHVLTTMSARIRWEKITGGNGATWIIKSVNNEQMVLDYDSGQLELGDTQTRRKCHFVFRKTGNQVIRQ